MIVCQCDLRALKWFRSFRRTSSQSASEAQFNLSDDEADNSTGPKNNSYFFALWIRLSCNSTRSSSCSTRLIAVWLKLPYYEVESVAYVQPFFLKLLL